MTTAEALKAYREIAPIVGPMDESVRLALRCALDDEYPRPFRASGFLELCYWRDHVTACLAERKAQDPAACIAELLRRIESAKHLLDAAINDSHRRWEKVDDRFHRAWLILDGTEAP